jgi:hypothetical protein
MDQYVIWYSHVADLTIEVRFSEDRLVEEEIRLIHDMADDPSDDIILVLS